MLETSIFPTVMGGMNVLQWPSEQALGNPFGQAPHPSTECEACV